MHESVMPPDVFNQSIELPFMTYKSPYKRVLNMDGFHYMLPEQFLKKAVVLWLSSTITDLLQNVLRLLDIALVRIP